ncbi:hypothetical protein RN06_1633 [Mycobacterium tuberculosis variant bovis BCG]|nr:hypothetical protein RN06_1633 [Mycobacterium tuberculosis variant bovis BCG]AMC72558.1 hypothetical protein RN11_1548 [Mycobacterium tuberculosis]
MIGMVVLVVVLGLAVLALSYRLWKLRQGERLGSCGTSLRLEVTAGATA